MNTITNIKSKAICLIIFVFVFSIFCTNSKATSLNTDNLPHFSEIIPGYDANGSYTFTQGSASWDDVSPNTWPAGRKMYYAPLTNNYVQAGAFVSASRVGYSTPSHYYNDPYKYKSQYRVASYTSEGRVDTEFSFFP